MTRKLFYPKNKFSKISINIILSQNVLEQNFNPVFTRDLREQIKYHI